MTKISDALTHGLTVRESATDGSDFTNPIADYRRLFLGEDGQLHVKDSAGAVTDIGVAGETPAFVGCRAYRSSTMTIPNDSPTAVLFDAENYDTDAIHDVSTNTTRFVIPAGMTGYWRFTGGGGWDTNTTGGRYLWWRKDGTTEINGGMVTLSAAVANVSIQTSVTLYIAAAAYMELMAYQSSGGDRTIGGTSGDPKFEAFCEAVFLGA
jgi:hypothetical protein